MCSCVYKHPPCLSTEPYPQPFELLIKKTKQNKTKQNKTKNSDYIRLTQIMEKNIISEKPSPESGIQLNGLSNAEPV